MIKNVSKMVSNRWFIILAIVVMVGVLPVYAAVRSVITSDEKIDAPKPASSQVVSKDEKNPEKAEKSSNNDSSTQATAQPSTAPTPTQPMPSTATPTQPTPVSKEAQPPQVPANSYIQGSGAWWADKRWAELGYGTQYLGETCSSWRTGAQAAGVSIVGGPDLHRIVCQDVSGYSSFGFIEQVRPDGYVVSAYNWAGEAGPKQMVITSFNGYSFFVPKQTTN